MTVTAAPTTTGTGGRSVTSTGVPTTSTTGSGDRPRTATAPGRLTTAVRTVRRVGGLIGMQAAGWGLLAVAVVSGVAGLVLGWWELRLIAIAAAVVLLCAVGFTVGRQTYQVTLRLQRAHVVVGERALGDLTVVNTSARRLFPARIELPVGRRTASFGLPSLAGNASHDEVFAVPTSRRTVITIGPARSVRGDPFGLLGREIRWTGAIELYVHPRTVPIPGRVGGFIRDLEGHTTSELTNSDVSFHALREYVAGDDRRYVHWRSSARTGTLMVRQFEETRRSHVVIGLDLEIASYLDPDEFELAVSVAGSLSVQALRDENEVGVFTSAGRLRAVGPRRVLDEMCSIRAGGPGGIAPLARTLHQTEPNASVVSLVTGSQPDLTTLRQAGATFGSDVRVLVVQVSTGAELAVRTIGAVSVATVGRLEDLPRAVRRAAR
ncbi:DUF58 domain-containing protein [Microlunatus sp. Y2014]|uniref:DUF58 domain-containing protein n=1 Tax=Microlunatus sp. Y2014 TaxID=3418488 RepID=UPI003DA75B1E